MSTSRKTAAPTAESLLNDARRIAETFASQRQERQRRRELHKADFDLLRDAGFLLTAIPVEHGGLWTNVPESTRMIAETLRTIAHGDSSVALVAAMHPGVIGAGSWTTEPKAPPEIDDAWQEQRRWVFQTCHDGHWWGTCVSEPGSGGDPSKTRSGAFRNPVTGQYTISGQKHFGSGSGITSFMVTRALVVDENIIHRFMLDMRGVPWDGSQGVELTAPWDGHGMTATQSHAMKFTDFPAIRSAWAKDSLQAGGFGSCLFSAVIVGIIEVAYRTAKEQLRRKLDSVRPFEQVEWTRVEMDNWLIHQAYEGALRGVEAGGDIRRNTLLAKENIATLAEEMMLRICKIMGGSSFTRYTPYNFWMEDVRSLGFLRPPWGFAFDSIWNNAWKEGDQSQELY